MNYPDSYRTLSSIERQATWNKIQGSISHSTEFSPSPYSGSSSLVKKPLLSRDYAIAFLCVLLLSSTTSVAAAADQSLPTSALYAIKLNITEPVRTLTKTTPESRIDWEIERTKRRLDETRQLIEQNNLTPKIALEISSHIEEHTQEAQSRIAELSTTDSNQSTILSLSLVEAIEKKKEEIIISTEHNFSFNISSTPISFTESIEAPVSEINEDSIANSNPAITQTESVLAILTVADQAQANTDTLIQDISEQSSLALAPVTDKLNNDTEPVPLATDPYVVTFTLVLSDIKSQIDDLEATLEITPTTPNEDENKKINSDNTEHQTPSDPDSPPVVPLQEITDDTNDQSIINSTRTLITDQALSTESTGDTLPIQLSVTEIVNTTNTTDTDTHPQTTELSAEPIETTSDTIIDVDATTASSTQLESPTDVYETIITTYKALQNVTQPTQDDIETARELRRKAETLISSLKFKPKQDLSIESDILEQISVQSLSLTAETDTPTDNNIGKPISPDSPTNTTQDTPILPTDPSPTKQN
jgi:hypothetical protein